MASRSKVLGHGTLGREEALGMPWRLEALHAPLPLQTEAEVQPDAMTDDLSREAVVFVRAGWCGGVHRKPWEGLSV